jgi:hypothetical protein
MSIEVVGAGEAMTVRQSAEQVEDDFPTAARLMGGEMLWTDDTEDLHGLRGKTSPLTAAGYTLKTKRGDHNGKSGWHFWAVKEEG